MPSQIYTTAQEGSGHMKNHKRRQFIASGFFGGFTSWLYPSHAVAEDRTTPHEIEGPFYPVMPQKDKDFDLTHVTGRRGPAKGKDIWITGEVYDSAGNPVEDAMVEIWHANAEGRYNHPHDPNPAPRDQNFQGWAIVPSGTAGGFRFHTVMPGSYPAGPGWERPPHIHFKVMKRGFVELITQMYFPGHPLNETDRLLQRKTDAEQKLMIAEVLRERDSDFHYRIVLERA